MLIKIVSEYEPCAIIVAWDGREKTFRHEEFVEYKAQRPSMPDLLSQQWPHFPELMEAFGVPNLMLEGYEADDILGTLAEEAKRQGVKSMLVTGDRDSLQVVDDDIWVMATGRGVTDVKIYTPQAVVERFGITPGLHPRLHRPQGRHLGQHPGRARHRREDGGAAAAAVRLHGGDVRAPGRDQVGEAPRAARASTRRSRACRKRLATMVLDVPLEEDLKAMVACRGYGRARWRRPTRVFAKYEFNTLRRRLQELDGGRRRAGPGVRPRRGVGRARQARQRARRRRAGRRAGEGRGGASQWSRPGDGRVAVAVYDGGEAALAAEVPAAELDALWLLGAHVVAHDAKAHPGFAAAPDGPGFDTAVAAYLLAPERPEKERELFALAGADEALTLVDGPLPEAAAATRAVLTWRVAESQRPRLVEQGLERLFREIELPLVGVLADMEAAGVRIDPYRLGEITARVRDRVDELTDRIQQLAGEPFTIGSTQQLAEVLFGRLGLEPARKGKTGYSTDARVLKGLREQHEIVPAVEEWRELTKLLNTYLEPLPAHVDPRTGRLHTTFKQMVASTGRLSSTNPNLQNIPIRTDLGAEIRSCFVAEEGAKLIVADYSQIELRLMASFASEPALIEAYHRGEDVHRVTAAAVAGIPVEEVTKRQRDRAKATNFGIMYGLSAFGLSEQVDIPLDEAKAFIEAYFEKYPKVKEFRERIIAQAVQDGYVTTLFGRRRAVPELRSSQLPHPLARRASGRQHRPAGHGRRHHQGGDGGHQHRAEGARHGLAARAADTRRAHPGEPGG